MPESRYTMFSQIIHRLIVNSRDFLAHGEQFRLNEDTKAISVVWIGIDISSIKVTDILSPRETVENSVHRIFVFADAA